MELFTKLGIDWQLLIAQLINFGLLIVALSYLVYRPIIRLLDDRRERIRKSMEEAKQIEHQKREMDALRLEQLRKVDQESGKILEQAKTQAESMKKEIMSSAEKEASQILVKAKQQIDEERTRMLQEAQESLAKIVITMTEKVLEREFSSGDQQRVLTNLKKEIPSLVR